MEYAIVIERSSTGFSAYVPDLPGCAVVGETEDEVRTLMRDAIPFHLQGLLEAGLSVPGSTSRVEYVDVSDDT